MKLIKLTFFILFFSFGISCSFFKASPFDDRIEANIRNHNLKAKIEIENLGLNNDFKMAVLADSHQSYEDLKKTVNLINKNQDIDFVVFSGDITNLGLAQEFDFFLKGVKGLNKPYVVVMGNHDAIGKGQILFSKVFGPYNFFIQFDGTYLIFWNANSLEFNDDLDYEWLEDQLDQAQSFSQIVVVQHINYSNKKYFNSDQISWMEQILNSKNVDLLLNSHRHVFNTSILGGTVIHQTSNLEGQMYSTVEFNGGQIFIGECEKRQCSISTY